MHSLPLIGISGWFHRNEIRDLRGVSLPYMQAVDQAGGLPVLLPPGLSQRALTEWLGRLDGLVMTGGGDLDPAYFGEAPHPLCDPPTPERDEFDMQLAQWVLETGKPTLAICRGMQVLAVADGGSLYQHIGEEHRVRDRRHEVVHTATVEPGSLLGRLTGVQEIGVNSIHHQAVRSLSERFRVVARAADGTVEAYEAPGLPFCLAVQWHPEALAPQLAEHAALFRALIEAAS
ncbi:MAG TPA: gamma-glutamyl-gamma-aminobutyrate hydrolase family protein [Symbiobacteriaceae bacterium]|nr:gamma-glutamyl-gamma-aminobutyrate hydrolase family protein [Symbiobacteriaceae bacterium]